MILHRLKEYIDYKHISVSKFETSIGMSNASFGKSLKNNGTIGADKLETILKTYPDLNLTWLITGTGSMLKENVSLTNEGNKEKIPVNEPTNELLTYLQKQIEVKDNEIKELVGEVAVLKSFITRVKAEMQKAGVVNYTVPELKL